MDPVQPLDAQQTAAAEKRALHHGYFVRNFLALDDLFATLTGDKVEGESESARWARLALLKPETTMEQLGYDIGVIGIRCLDVIQDNHGALAIAGDNADGQHLANVEAATGAIQP